jgi:branched-chain amino acid transport system ATP-binding protein
MTNSLAAFETRDLFAYYGALTAVNGVNLRFGVGERIGIFGHNGSGKSTLLKCLVGAIDDTEGEVFFHDQPIESGAPHRNVVMGIGIVPQVHNVFASLSVEQCLRIAGMRRGKKDITAVFDLFPLLHERRSQRAGLMSGGEQQMLAVGMALMTEPKAILLDEPTAGLSPVAAETVLGAIRSINAKTGATIVLVEQNVLAALDVVEHAVVMRSGQIVYHGSSADLQRKEDLWQWF